MNSVSYSQYTMWSNCQLAWKLKYADGHRYDDSNINSVFGTSMHEVIQEWLDVVYSGNKALAKTADLDANLVAKFHTLFKEATVTNEDGTKTFICDKPTLEEYYVQGTQILDYLKNNIEKVFPTENEKLVGIEFPIDVEIKTGVKFVGYVDILTYNEESGVYTIFDLKTSKSGWSSYQKQDKVKISQLLLYKKFISEHFNVPLTHVRVEYIILKRIVTENSLYKNPRVSLFEPPNGKPSVTKAWDEFSQFLDSCFDESGQHKTDAITHTANKSACRFCVYRDKKELCAYGVDD